MSTETPSPTPQSCQGILTDALQQLSVREARLAKLGEELNATRTAIKGLRKLIKSLSPAASRELGPTPRRTETAKAPVQGPIVAIVGVLKTSMDLLDVQQIAERLGRGGQGLPAALDAAVRRGELIKTGGRYGLPTPGASAEDLAAANGAG